MNSVNDFSRFLIVSPGTSEVQNKYVCAIQGASPTSAIKHASKSTINYGNEEGTTSLQWTREHTLILIECYRIFRNKVGQMDMKNLKKMWEVIAAHILEKFNIKYTAQNCENRWRVLERNYKKYIENNSQTGRGRKCFEFAKEMDEIFIKKKNIYPEILLTSSDVIKPNKNPEPQEEIKTTNEIVEETVVTLGKTKTSPGSSILAPTPNRKRKHFESVKYKKDTILQQMQMDRKQYQEERLKLEKFKIDQMLAIEREKLEIKKKRNELLQVKNDLLQKIVSNTNSSTLSIL